MIDPEKTIIIANPTSGAGSVAAQWDQIEPMLRTHLGPVEIAKTQGPGDATTLAREAVKKGFTTILSLGGDGTHNEIVSGIMATNPAPGDITLGILPSGTGGDFRRLLIHGEDLETSAKAMKTAEAHPIDVGHVEFCTDDGAPATRHFLNMASFGMGGLICRIANTSTKRFGGWWTFLVATVRAWTIYRTVEMRVVVDGMHIGDIPISNVQIGNGQFSGGGMWITPKARLADGMLDVIIFRKANMIVEARNLRLIYEGAHLDSDNISAVRGKVVELTPQNGRAAWVDLDGEAPGVAPAKISVRPGAIRLLDPRPDIL